MIAVKFDDFKRKNKLNNVIVTKLSTTQNNTKDYNGWMETYLSPENDWLEVMQEDDRVTYTFYKVSTQTVPVTNASMLITAPERETPVTVDIVKNLAPTDAPEGTFDVLIKLPSPRVGRSMDKGKFFEYDHVRALSTRVSTEKYSYEESSVMGSDETGNISSPVVVYLTNRSLTLDELLFNIGLV